MTEGAFKSCSMCKSSWEKQQDFLADQKLKLCGYQPHFSEPESGSFLFNHMVNSWQSTIAVRVEEFINLYTGVKYPESRMGSSECPGHCLNSECLDHCNAPCRFAYVREIMQVIKEQKINLPE